MFAYCNNDPVIFEDSCGKFPWFIVPIIIGFGVLLSGCESEEEESWPKDCLYRYNEGGSGRTDDNCYSYAFEYSGVCDPGHASGVSPYVMDVESGKYEFA